MNSLPVERRKDIERTPADTLAVGIDDLFDNFSDNIVQGGNDPLLTPARTGEEELQLRPSVVFDIDGSTSVNTLPNLKRLSVIRPVAGTENTHLLGGYRLSLIQEADGQYSSVTYRVDGNDVMKQSKKPVNSVWTREDAEQYERQMQARVKLSEEVLALDAVSRAAALRIVKGEVVQQGELSDILDIIASAIPDKQTNEQVQIGQKQ